MMVSHTVVMRRAPALGGGGLVWTNYVAHANVAVLNAKLLSALLELAGLTSFTQPEAANLLRDRIGLTTEAAQALIIELTRHQILVETGPDLVDRTHMKQVWEQRNWLEAFIFHYSTRDYPFLDYASDGYAADRQLMEDFSTRNNRPPNSKVWDKTLPTWPLPRSAKDDERRLRPAQWRDIFGLTVAGTHKLTLADLSTILFTASGVTGRKQWAGQGEFFFTLLPSGGARHPTEIYVANLRLSELPRAWFHYGGSDHVLTQLTSETQNLDEDVQSVFPDLGRRASFTPTVVFILSSLVIRSMWRYRDSRSFRVICIDCGHVLNMLRLSAANREVDYWVGHDIDHAGLATRLGLPPDDEPILFGGAFA